MKNRGKGEGSQERAEYTPPAVETIAPELPGKAVSAITDADIFIFRNGRRRAGTKPSTINRDLRTIRAALKLARPDYRFPGGAFFKEDETRVRWLRPEEEPLVLEPMASPFREIAKLAALTLMRMTEIRNLRREYFHLEQGVIMLPVAKAGARPVMLSGAARKILAGQLEAAAKDCWCDGQERPPTNQRLSLPRPPATRGDYGPHQGFYGADRHGPGRLENGADDAPIAHEPQPGLAPASPFVLRPLDVLLEPPLIALLDAVVDHLAEIQPAQ